MILLKKSGFKNNKLFKGDQGKLEPFIISDMFSNKQSPVNKDENLLQNKDYPYFVTRGEDYKDTVGIYKRTKFIEKV